MKSVKKINAIQKTEPEWYIEECTCIDCYTYRLGKVTTLINNKPMHQVHMEQQQKMYNRKKV